MMKKLIIFFTFIWISTTQADVYLNGNYYLHCNGCNIETDFISQARLHFENLHPYSDDIPISGISEKYIVVNLNSLQLKTVLVSWQTRVVSGPFGRTRGTEIQLAAYIRNNDTETEMYVNEYEANKVEFDSSFEFQSYQGETQSIAGHWNKLYLGEGPLPWSSSTSFANEVSAWINNRLDSEYYNPLHFVRSPLAVEVETPDGYFVVLIASSNLDSARQWKVFYVKSGPNYLDKFGNQIALSSSINTSFLCLATGYGETCRSISSSNEPIGGIFIRPIIGLTYSDGCKINCPPPTGGCPAGSTTCQAGNGSEP